MTDGQAFLTGLRLSDSFLPVGSFTASYGIEQYIAAGVIDDANDLRAVLSAYLERLVGPCETAAVANAHTASEEDDLERLLAVDERLHAVTMPREFRESSTKAGTQLSDLLLTTEGDVNSAGVGAVGVDVGTDVDAEHRDPAHARFGEAIASGSTPGHHAVVFGVVAQRAGLERLEACLAQSYAFLTGLLGAAQRLGRFGHTEIQSILDDLLPDLEGVCRRFVETPLAEMGAFAPFAEIMGMRHERAQRRLFVS